MYNFKILFGHSYKILFHFKILKDFIFFRKNYVCKLTTSRCYISSADGDNDSHEEVVSVFLKTNHEVTNQAEGKWINNEAGDLVKFMKKNY